MYFLQKSLQVLLKSKNKFTEYILNDFESTFKPTLHFRSKCLMRVLLITNRRWCPQVKVVTGRGFLKEIGILNFWRVVACTERAWTCSLDPHSSLRGCRMHYFCMHPLARTAYPPPPLNEPTTRLTNIRRMISAVDFRRTGGESGSTAVRAGSSGT